MKLCGAISVARPGFDPPLATPRHGSIAVPVSEATPTRFTAVQAEILPVKGEERLFCDSFGRTDGSPSISVQPGRLQEA